MPEIGLRLDDRLHTAVTAEAARRGTTLSGVVRDGLTRAYSLDRPVYGPGAAHSFVGDAYGALTGTGGDPDAAHRITRFRGQLADGTALAAFGLLHTGNAAAVIPPGYDPAALAATDADRPLWALGGGHRITGPQPFTIPGVVATTGATGAHVEGVNPAPGGAAFTGGTVTPHGYSGLFDATREVVDSANPALDTVVLGELVEDYHRQLEQLVAAELATLTPAGTTAAATIAADLRKQIARMVAARRRRPAAAAVSAAATIADALAAGLDESTGTPDAPWHTQGVPIRLAPDLGPATTGQLIAAVTAPDSLYTWGSGPTTFRYEQVTGPALIRLAIHGYAAARTVRPTGVRVLVHS